jgi:coenzyme F420 hydrogenase subunit beta
VEQAELLECDSVVKHTAVPAVTTSSRADNRHRSGAEQACAIEAVARQPTSSEVPEAVRLRDTVVAGGYCIGCGACAAVERSPFEMTLDERGRWQARLRADATPAMLAAPVLEVCPFSGRGPDEDDIARRRYATATPHPQLGFHRALYAGHVAEGEHRARGSSGGFTSWLLEELLTLDLVDAVLHVKPQTPTADDPLLFRYGASTTPAEVRAGAKSRYYPVELSGALRALREGPPRRYAVVGVPCFVKAVRRLALADDRVAERVAFAVALFCGHLKSARFAELLAMELDVPLGDLRAIDFRQKLAGRTANRYGVTVWSTDGAATTRPMSDVIGHNWGHGVLKYRACDYCDDVAGETADVAVGDAWLPRYSQDAAGTNVIVVRHPTVERLIENGRARGRLTLDELTPQDVVRSQRSGFRHRRDGLAYRLARDDARGIWRPVKRVHARADHLSRLSKELFRVRSRLADRSHDAFAEVRDRGGSLDPFRRRLAPLMRRHDAIARVQSLPDRRAVGRLLALVGRGRDRRADGSR